MKSVHCVLMLRNINKCVRVGPSYKVLLYPFIQQQQRCLIGILAEYSGVLFAAPAETNLYSCQCLSCMAGSNPSRLSAATVQTRRWFIADEHPRRALASGRFRSAAQPDVHVCTCEEAGREASTPHGKIPLGIKPATFSL